MRFILLFLVIALNITQANAQISLKIVDSLTVDSLGACQGISIQNDKIFLYGDRETGIAREYKLKNDSLRYSGNEIRFTLDGKDLINHPTGFAHFENNIFIGNSSRLNPEGPLWKANIFFINWNKLQKTKDLKKSLIRVIDDDACIQGTRPEFINYNGKKFIATADYGNKRNEVRLYDYEKMKHVSKTSTPGVLIHKFTCSPWVQNLKWVPKKGILILIQNQVEGRYWRFTFIDLKKSIATGEEFVLKTIDIDNPSELEGFDLIDLNNGIATTSSRKNNMFFIKLTW